MMNTSVDSLMNSQQFQLQRILIEKTIPKNRNLRKELGLPLDDYPSKVKVLLEAKESFLDGDMMLLQSFARFTQQENRELEKKHNALSQALDFGMPSGELSPIPNSPTQQENLYRNIEEGSPTSLDIGSIIFDVKGNSPYVKGNYSYSPFSPNGTGGSVKSKLSDDSKRRLSRLQPLNKNPNWSSSSQKKSMSERQRKSLFLPSSIMKSKKLSNFPLADGLNTGNDKIYIDDKNSDDINEMFYRLDTGP